MAYPVFFSWCTSPCRAAVTGRPEPIFDIAAGLEMKHITKLLWQLQQLDYFCAQFLNLVVIRSKTQGAARLKISFCPCSSSLVCISYFFESVIGKASPKICRQMGIC